MQLESGNPPSTAERSRDDDHPQGLPSSGFQVHSRLLAHRMHWDRSRGKGRPSAGSVGGPLAITGRLGQPDSSRPIPPPPAAEGPTPSLGKGIAGTRPDLPHP